MQQPSAMNSSDAQVVHQPDLVVGEGAPRVVDLHRAGGFAADGVALVHRDDAEVVLEHLHRVERRRCQSLRCVS